MKHVFPAILLLLLHISSYGQQSSDSVAAILQDSWEVFHVSKGSSLSQDILESFRNNQPVPYSKHNYSRYYFHEDGSFRLMSIGDYGLSSEEGTYIFSDDGSTIDRTITYPNAWRKKRKDKSKIIKSKLLYIADDLLVINTKNRLIYLRLYR